MTNFDLSRLEETVYLITDGVTLHGAFRVEKHNAKECIQPWEASGYQVLTWEPQPGDRIEFPDGGGYGTVDAVQETAVRIIFDDGDCRLLDTVVLDPISSVRFEGSLA